MNHPPLSQHHHPVRSLFLATLALSLSAAAGALPGDWTGDYEVCENHASLYSKDRMELGVRFSTSDQGLAAAFARAMDFWAGVLDMKWHEEGSKACSLAVIDGTRNLFEPAQAARAQFPYMPEFRGWIAFNPEIHLSQREQYTVAVHELGHVFGLGHNEDPSSVMYFLCLEGQLSLDNADLAALANRHKLRVGRGTAHLW